MNTQNQITELENQIAQLHLQLSKVRQAQYLAKERVLNEKRTLALSAMCKTLQNLGLKQSEIDAIVSGINVTRSKKSNRSKKSTTSTFRSNPKTTSSGQNKFGPTLPVGTKSGVLQAPDGCLQAVLVTFADEYNFTGRQCKAVANECGKQETLSMARNKFKKKPHTWGAQYAKAKPYCEQTAEQWREYFRTNTIH